MTRSKAMKELLEVSKLIIFVEKQDLDGLHRLRDVIDEAIANKEKDLLK